MSSHGNLCSPFGFLKQVPRHLNVDVLSLEQAFVLKGQMEDDMLVRGKGRKHKWTVGTRERIL